MYIYKSPVGVFWIKLHNGRFVLGIDNQMLGSYNSAVAAADDVYTFSTGCFKWDKHCADIDYQLNVPTDIYEWECVK